MNKIDQLQHEKRFTGLYKVREEDEQMERDPPKKKYIRKENQKPSIIIKQASKEPLKEPMTTADWKKL